MILAPAAVTHRFSVSFPFSNPPRKKKKIPEDKTSKFETGSFSVFSPGCIPVYAATQDVFFFFPSRKNVAHTKQGPRVFLHRRNFALQQTIREGRKGDSAKKKLCAHNCREDAFARFAQKANALFFQTDQSQTDNRALAFAHWMHRLLFRGREEKKRCLKRRRLAQKNPPTLPVAKDGHSQKAERAHLIQGNFSAPRGKKKIVQTRRGMKKKPQHRKRPRKRKEKTAIDSLFVGGFFDVVGAPLLPLMAAEKVAPLFTSSAEKTLYLDRVEAPRWSVREGKGIGRSSGGAKKRNALCLDGPATKQKGEREKGKKDQREKKTAGHGEEKKKMFVNNYDQGSGCEMGSYGTMSPATASDLMTPMDMLAGGAVMSGQSPLLAAPAVIGSDGGGGHGHGPSLLVRCGSVAADEIVRYAAHLMLHGRPTTAAASCAESGWSTPRDAIRVEAIGPLRDASDKRTTVFHPDAGTWRFVDPDGRRFVLDMRVNAQRPVGSDGEARLYWEAVLRHHRGTTGMASLGPFDRAPTESPSLPESTTTTAVDQDGHDALAAFIDAAHRHAEPRAADRISVKRWTGTHWARHSRPSKRPLDTLFLPADTLASAVEDVSTFLNGEADYVRFGRPYKRVYLLSGAPGLGKSSLALALAGRFDLDLYVYPVDDESTDQGLASAVVNLDAPCMLLIEDVDVAGGGPKSHLTVSGLTNVLDGAQTRHGVAVFLTTNHPERIDPTITRSGRVDVWLRFDAATVDQIAAMVQHHFASQFSDNDGDGGDDESVPAKRRRTLHDLAEALAQRRVSAAALSEFLFERRRSEDILADLAANTRTIGRRSQTNAKGFVSSSSSSSTSRGVDGGRDDVDVMSMYC